MSDNITIGDPVEVAPPIKAKPIKSITAKDSGVLIGSSLDEQYRLAKAYHASKLMPAALDTPEKILVAIQLCHELGLPPMTSIGKICVINGTPSLFGELPLSLVMKSGLMKVFREEFIMNGDKLIGARCTVQREGLDIVVREFTETDAKQAGIFGKGVWTKYPKRMYQFRARGWALKDAFPDVLGGIAQAEYDFNSTIENGRVVGEVEFERSSSKADEINKLFGDENEEKEVAGQNLVTGSEEA